MGALSMEFLLLIIIFHMLFMKQVFNEKARLQGSPKCMWTGVLFAFLGLCYHQHAAGSIVHLGPGFRSPQK